MEIDVRMTSDSPDRAATLDFLAANFTEPLAGRVLGEIFPQQAQPGVLTEFTYYLAARKHQRLSTASPSSRPRRCTL